MRFVYALIVFLAWIPDSQSAPRIAPPPAGKLYQGLYFDDPKPGNDPTEHDVTAAEVERWDRTFATKTIWVYFSNNWSESRRFPTETCDWIKALYLTP